MTNFGNPSSQIQCSLSHLHISISIRSISSDVIKITQDSTMLDCCLGNCGRSERIRSDRLKTGIIMCHEGIHDSGASVGTVLDV